MTEGVFLILAKSKTDKVVCNFLLHLLLNVTVRNNRMSGDFIALLLGKADRSDCCMFGNITLCLQ